MKKSQDKTFQRNNQVAPHSLKNMRRLFVTLSVIAAIGAIIIISVGISRLWGLIKTSDWFSTESSVSSIPIFVTSEVTTPEEVIEEKLPQNLLADKYWGELEIVTNKTQKELTHNNVKAIYIGPASNLEECLKLCDNSEINTVVIDFKTEKGVIFGSKNAMANGIGYAYEKYSAKDIIELCHSHNVSVIARIVCFNDSFAAEKLPDQAIKDSNGHVLHYKSEGGKAFLNPYDKRNWEYLISLGEEAVSMGADEIQFDYVRFPVGSTKEGTKPFFGQEDTTPTRADAINRFLQTARIRIQDKFGVPLSADIFAIVLTSPMDAKNLGQDFKTIGFTGIDSVCPMLYPSHYANGTIINGITFEYPDKEPFMLSYQVLQKCKETYEQEGYTTVRPYLQAFTATYIGAGNYMEYDYNAINSQIRACHESGLEEFILWDPSYSYPEGDYSGNIADDVQ